MVFNYFTTSSLINAFTSFFLCFFLLFRSPKSKLNNVFCLFTFVVGFWATGLFFTISARDPDSALFFNRALMMAAVFIPSSYLHFVCLLLGIYEEKKK
ncbi:MAG: hypothetical protein HY591_06090, partial [Candidatus Omnitrophica bacterium]|nr:hypothetical protein [Candidatus Omnitrophota bacterium]